MVWTRVQINLCKLKRNMRYSILLLISLFQFSFAQNSLERLENSPRHHEWVKITTNTNEINSFLVYPEVSEKVPVVVLIHENRGLNDWARSMADQIAEMGYIAIAPDFLSGTAPNGGEQLIMKIQMMHERGYIILTPLSLMTS